MVWTDLLRLGDAQFDLLDPAHRERLYLNLISPTRWSLFLKGLLGADLLRLAFPTTNGEPQIPPKALGSRTEFTMMKKLLYRRTLRFFLPTRVAQLLVEDCEIAREDKGYPRYLLDLAEFQKDLQESPMLATTTQSPEIPECF